MMPMDVLETVLKYDGSDVLTVYLDVDPTKQENQGSRRAYQIWLADRIKKLAGSIESGEEKAAWRKSTEAVQEFVDSFRPRSKGVVIFSGPALWHIVETPSAPRNRIWWGYPLVVPLRRHLARRHRFGSVIVDQEKARFLAGDPYDVEEIESTKLINEMSVEPQRHETPSFRGGSGIPASGDRDDGLQGRAQAVLHRFMDKVVQQMTQLAGDYDIERWVITGPTEVRAALRDEMPLGLRDQVLGEVALSTWAGKGEIRDKILPFWQQAEEEEQTVLVDKLLQQAETDFQVVMGAEDTLRAIQAGRSSLVVMTHELDGDAWVCPACGWITLEAQPCPICQTGTRQVHLATAVERRAREMGSEVEIIAGPPAQKLAAKEGIGAFLRF